MNGVQNQYEFTKGVQNQYRKGGVCAVIELKVYKINMSLMIKRRNAFALY